MQTLTAEQLAAIDRCERAQLTGRTARVERLHTLSKDIKQGFHNLYGVDEEL